MSRIPPQPRHKLPSEAQKVHDHFAEFTARAYGANGQKFIYADHQDAFIGGFPLFVQHPQVAFAHNGIARSLSRMQQVPDRAKNTVTLAVAGYFRAASEIASQSNRYLHDKVFTPAEVESLTRAENPGTLDETCNAAFEAIKYLISTPGRLPQHLWGQCVDFLGEEGTFGILLYVGFYAWLSVGVNAADVRPPQRNGNIVRVESLG